MSPSFTTVVPNILSSGPVVDILITVSAKLEDKLKQEGKPIPPPEKVPALIDTGASHTCISQSIIDKLMLEPVGVININTPSSQNVQCGRYAVRLGFPGGVAVQTQITGVPLKGQNIACLIGRDLLVKGVFIYIGYLNQFTVCLI
jgi:predicted aspartyl protease